MADEYKKSLVVNVKPELDKTSVEKFQEEFSSIILHTDIESINKFKDEKESDYQKEVVKALKDIKKEGKKDNGEGGQGKKPIKGPRDSEGDRNSNPFVKAFGGEIKSYFLGGSANVTTFIATRLAKVLTDALDKLKEIFEDAWSDLREVINSSIGSSGKFNAVTSSLYARYGITGANAYALQGALKETGYGNIETLLDNPWTLTPEIQNNLKDWFKLYKEQYESSKELSDAYQEFTIEFQKAQMEIKNSIIDFIVQNKDLIIGALNAILSIMNGINDIIEMISGRSESERRDAAYDIISSTGNTVSSTFTMNNTYNGIGEKDATWIANTNSLAYAQIKKANS